MELYRCEYDDHSATRVAQFTIHATEDTETSTKALANQMDYLVHDNTNQEIQPAHVAGGTTPDQRFFKTMQAVCGTRIAKLADAPREDQGKQDEYDDEHHHTHRIAEKQEEDRWDYQNHTVAMQNLTEDCLLYTSPSPRD